MERWMSRCLDGDGQIGGQMSGFGWIMLTKFGGLAVLGV
jgi:hypothetical protein